MPLMLIRAVRLREVVYRRWFLTFASASDVVLLCQHFGHVGYVLFMGRGLSAGGSSPVGLPMLLKQHLSIPVQIH